MDLQVSFLKQFNLCPVTRTNDSCTISENHKLVPPRQYSSLLEKNNSIVTGYENFFIKKGTVKLFPNKDFDFIGKHVVCQKCCQTFASKMSYRAHVGTSICIRTYNGPNLVYLQFKYRNSKRFRKKNKKLIEDLPNYIKKNLLNPEMLNTLQTRNNCYSDVVHQRNKMKEKQKSGSDDSSVKKPRGRPKKIIEVEPKKRGRPKKLNKVSIDNPIQKDDDSCNNLVSNDVESNESSSSASVRCDDDAYNNNILKMEKLEYLYSNMKSMVDSCCQTLLNVEELKNQLQHSIEDDKYGCSPVGNKHLLLYVTSLGNDLRKMSAGIQAYDGDDSIYKKKMDLLLLELNEKYQEYQQIKTDFNDGLMAGKGKENMSCTILIDHETDSSGTSTDNNTDTYSNRKKRIAESVIKLWMNESEDFDFNMDENTFGDVITLDSDTSSSPPDNSDDMTGSMNGHSNDDDRLHCGLCDTSFASIAEWKMHYSEHTAKKNNNFLCKVCGHRFKVYKNYVKHVRLHEMADWSEQERKIIDDQKCSKKLICKACGRHYNYMKSYFAHIKTHLK